MALGFPPISFAITHSAPPCPYGPPPSIVHLYIFNRSPLMSIFKLHVLLKGHAYKIPSAITPKRVTCTQAINVSQKVWMNSMSCAERLYTLKNIMIEFS